MEEDKGKKLSKTSESQKKEVDNQQVPEPTKLSEEDQPEPKEMEFTGKQLMEILDQLEADQTDLKFEGFTPCATLKRQIQLDTIVNILQKAEDVVFNVPKKEAERLKPRLFNTNDATKTREVLKEDVGTEDQFEKLVMFLWELIQDKKFADLAKNIEDVKKELDELSGEKWDPKKAKDCVDKAMPLLKEALPETPEDMVTEKDGEMLAHFTCRLSKLCKEIRIQSRETRKTQKELAKRQ